MKLTSSISAILQLFNFSISWNVHCEVFQKCWESPCWYGSVHPPCPSGWCWEGGQNVMLGVQNNARQKRIFKMLNCLQTLKLDVIYFASFVCSWSTSAIRLKKLPSRLLYWNVTTSDARFQRIFTLFQNGGYCCNWEQFHLKKAFLKLRGLVAFEQLRLIAFLVTFLKAFKTQNSATGQMNKYPPSGTDIRIS